LSQVIDFESHVQASEYIKEMQQYDGYPRYRPDSKGRFTWYASPTVFEVRNNLRPKFEDVAVRLADMERAGIDTQVISGVAPGCEVFPREMGIRLARINNDFVAEIVRRDPGHFVGLATLPMQDIEASLLEFDRAMGLGLRGLMMYSNVNGKRVDLEEFWPIYEKAEKLRAPIFLHPTVPANADSYSQYNMWGPVLGFGVDAETAALRLIMAGVFEKFPNLHVVLGHLGETIPFFLRRIDFVYLRTPEVVPNIRKRPSEYFLSNFYVDTAGVFHEPALKCAYDTLDHSRILFATDYPLEDGSKGKAFIAESRIPEEDKKRIYGQNAAALLRI
jgi:predicted TIM-barrel fold metal-dependent hydrolase